MKNESMRQEKAEEKAGAKKEEVAEQRKEGRAEAKGLDEINKLENVTVTFPPHHSHDEEVA